MGCLPSSFSKSYQLSHKFPQTFATMELLCNKIQPFQISTLSNMKNLKVFVENSIIDILEAQSSKWTSSILRNNHAENHICWITFVRNLSQKVFGEFPKIFVAIFQNSGWLLWRAKGLLNTNFNTIAMSQLSLFNFFLNVRVNYKFCISFQHSEKLSLILKSKTFRIIV